MRLLVDSDVLMCMHVCDRVKSLTHPTLHPLYALCSCWLLCTAHFSWRAWKSSRRFIFKESEIL